MSAISMESSPAEHPSLPVSSSNRLPHVDALMLIRNFPISLRIELLWAISVPIGADLDGQLSDKAIVCKYSSQQSSKSTAPMQALLSRSTWPNRINLPKGPRSSHAFAKGHSPVLRRLLRPPEVVSRYCPVPYLG